MATPYRPIQRTTATNSIGFNNSGDARVATRNQRQLTQGAGDAIMANDADLANQYRDQSQGVEDYLDPIQSNMAEGNGGYSPTESAAINYTPEQQQQLVTSAGISAGTGTAAAVGGAQRAANAGGGSPMALAAYRARAANTEAAQSSDAMTRARVAGHDAGAAGAKTTGDARLGQQDKALGYYQGLQGQKNQNALNEQGLQQGAFGTTVSGTGAATGDVLKASQTPSTSDKIIGGIAGVAKGFLADGYLDDAGSDAVVGEDGPEAIISAPHMADGGFSEGPETEGFGQSVGDVTQGDDKARSRGGALMDYLSKSRQKQAAAPAQPQEQWNKTTPYAQAGEAVGQGAAALSAFLADGTDGSGDNDGGGGGSSSPWWKDLATYGIKSAAHSVLPSVFMADGTAPQTPQIITTPTRVHLDKGDTVVPLSYRPKAKVRPSAAMAAFTPRVRPSYGAAHA